MIGILGLIGIGIWAGGIAKQRGMNKYIWTLIPIGVYFIVYIIAYLALNLGLKAILSPTEDRFPVLMTILFIKVAIALLSFLITKLIMDEIFKRINKPEKN